MSYLELTYQNFISRISEVNKKDILLSLSRKILLFIIFAVTLAFIYISSEAIFDFSSSIRKVLFFSYLSLLFTGLLYVLFDSYTKYSKIRNPERIRFYAGRIGMSFPDVKDNLLNAIQIYEDANNERLISSKDLAAESILLVNEKTKPYNFTNTISFNRNKKLALFSSATVLVFTALLLTFPNVFQASANRLIDYNFTYIENTLGIAYEVKPGNIEISKGDNVDLYTKINFNDPNYQTENIRVYTRILSTDGIELSSDNEKISSSSTNEFKFTLVNVTSPTEYWFEYKGIKSTIHKISVTNRPVLKNIKITVFPPAYTKLPSRVVEGNEITTIAGSKIYIELEASENLSRSAVLLAGGMPLGLDVNGNKSVGSFTALQSGNFRVTIAKMFGDKELTNLNSPEYTLRVYPDEYPRISIVEPNAQAEVQGEKEILVRSRISDDFGFTKMRIGYKLAKSKYGMADKDYLFEDISIKNTDATGVEVPYLWNLSSLNLGTEDEVEYFMEVYDNDAITGPKSARSDVFRLIYPSFESLFKKTEKTKEEVENSIKSAYEDAMELKQELDEIKEQIERNPEEMGLNDPKKNQELQNKIDNIQNQLSSTQKKMQDLMNDLQNNNQVSKETLEKFMELQKLFQQIDSKELRDALKKLQEAMKNMNTDQMKEALKNFKFDEETFKKSMEKTMELLKKIMNEQKFGELTKKLDEITKNQDQLKENTEKTNEQNKEKMNELSKTQEQLKKEMEDFQKQMKELSENMKKLKNDQISKEMEKLLNDLMKKMLEQKMQQSQQNLEQGNKNQSQKQQQQLSKDLNEMNKRMQELLAQMIQNENSKTMQKLQEMLEKLQEMSEKQGKLKEQSKDLDPKQDGSEFKENAQQQSQLSNELSNTIEDLMSMSQELGNQMPMLGKELGNAFNEMNEATESLNKKDGKSANKSQGEAKESLDNAIGKLQQMCKNGQQPGQGNSLQQLLQALQEMIAKQQSLNQQMGQFGPNGNQGKLSQEEMAQMQRLAVEQETLRKNLQNLNEDVKKQQEMDGKKLLGNLDQIQKDMMEVIKDLQNNNITPETRKRQEKILSRMLDFQLSAREKDFEQKRESRPGKNFDRVSPPEVVISRPDIINGVNRDVLDLQKENYSDEYELLIQKYMQKIKAGSKEK